MRKTGLMVLLLAVLVLVLSGCGEKAQQEKAYATPKEAIVAYCNEKGVHIRDLNISSDKKVSVHDPDWEIDYAFPAAAEGEGYFFLLHKTSGGWMVIAHTAKVGWTAEQLRKFGAPTDLVLYPKGSSS
jgi:hypothetical protein